MGEGLVQGIVALERRLKILISYVFIHEVAVISYLELSYPPTNQPADGPACREGEDPAAAAHGRRYHVGPLAQIDPGRMN